MTTVPVAHDNNISNSSNDHANDDLLYCDYGGNADDERLTGVGDSPGSNWDDSGCSVAESTTSEPVIIAKKETKAVVRLKLLVLVVLVVSASVTASLIYLYLKWSEEDSFRSQFNDDAEKVLSAVGSTLDNILGSFDSLAVSSISFARATNQTWPYVTLPDFAVRMAKVLPLSRTFVMYVCPLVTPDQRGEWERYTSEHNSWVNRSIQMQTEYREYRGPLDDATLTRTEIHGDFGVIPRNQSRNHLPVWQNFPVVPNHPYTYNWDWLSLSFPEAPMACLAEHQAVISKPYMIPTKGNEIEEAETKAWGDYFKFFIPPDEDPMEPVSDLIYPIVDDIDHIYVAGSGEYEPGQHSIVGVITASIYWRSIFRDVLPKESNGIYVVVENTCANPFTYQILGPTTRYVGVGDVHDTKYDKHAKSSRLDKLGEFVTLDSVYSGAHIHGEYCPFTLTIYPSDEMKAAFTTQHPVLFAVVALLIFSFTSLVFFLYDSKVERRQEAVMSTARRSSMIVSSLFPSTVRDKLYPLPEKPRRRHSMEAFMPSHSRDCTASSTDYSSSNSYLDSSPIAELYPDTTVLFADISGFTAWSSARQPTQVFHLLETVYAAFDAIARYRGVFKVETIGDSYVAAVGLPFPRNHHAVVMAMFAGDCRDKFCEVTVELEKTLGPGTADLAMRFGMNSGPTTGGVLRGEKARYQLFGDTVNTAARMESNGERNRIQVSQKTAALIKLAGKGDWLTPRDEKVACKGKGMMTTYWCDPVCKSNYSSATFQAEPKSDCDEAPSATDDEVRLERLIDWNVDLFTSLLVDVAKYQAATYDSPKAPMLDLPSSSKSIRQPLDELAEVIPFSEESTCTFLELSTDKDVRISPKVVAQLRSLITSIASLYRANPFHNFDHCSQVVMSSKKLLDRIAGHMNFILHGEDNDRDETHSEFNDATFDPLTRFAIVFSALIHDVDHPGVSNAQLVQEHSALAAAYNGQSVAEQNSVVLAWQLLMEAQYADLRCCLFATEADVTKFRQVVVNVVLATDLFDANLKSIREARWSKSFEVPSSTTTALTSAGMMVEDTNRRATIIADLVIQASDVSHTMQHFVVYQKWNLRLLTEMYQAYQEGRTTKDPLDGWYEGELWFFDNYVIPLAEKLRECGVFGVSCDEFLDYARDNRLEWHEKGRGIVQRAAQILQSKE